ncbi:MAG: hypothetical protein ACI8XM_002253 [Haloarculaceae archaeon]|jgi:hypothetical protein
MSNNKNQRRKQKQQRNRVVARALRNRDKTRQNLLAQGRKLARRRAENVDRDTDRSGDDRESTNVSAHSTVPPIDSNEEAAMRHSHSTVPARPKGSTVPAAVRLYGRRLYEQTRADRDGGSEGELTPEHGEDDPAADGRCPEVDTDEGERQ